MKDRLTLVDTHAHIDQPAFQGDLPKVLDSAAAAGVGRVIAIGISAESSGRCVALARRYGAIDAAVGIQPNDLSAAQPNDWDQVVALANDAHVVAIGETGLDRYWDDTPFEQQEDYFDRHMRLARDQGLPFVVHMRDCEADILRMLREEHRRAPLRGVMHSFTGSAETAAECIAMGMHISFAGMVTFKKSDDLRAVARTVPLDRLLVETDSPYLSPEPVRKIRRNEPSHVAHTARLLAKTRSEDFEAFCAQTTRNAEALFRRHPTS